MSTQNGAGSTSYRFYLLLAGLVILVVADGLITGYLVNNGIAAEGNLLLRHWAGEWYFPVIKGLGALLCGLLIWDIYRRWPKLATVSSTLFVIGYGAIVSWNSWLLLSHLV
jgi:hypothetical protein